jgi:type II secretory pathway component PulM
MGVRRRDLLARVEKLEAEVAELRAVVRSPAPAPKPHSAAKTKSS